jgi:hypothetical protein
MQGVSVGGSLLEQRAVCFTAGRIGLGLVPYGISWAGCMVRARRELLTNGKSFGFGLHLCFPLAQQLLEFLDDGVMLVTQVVSFTDVCL